MAAQTTQKLILELPSALVERLQRAADDQRQPVDHVVAEALDISLPPLDAEIEAEFEQRVEELQDQDRVQLQASARASLTPSKQKRLKKLLQENKLRELIPAEKEEIERLLDDSVDVVTTRVAALWLLKSRTEPKPP